MDRAAERARRRPTRTFGAALEAAHRAYAAERGEMADEARAWGGVAGTRTGVKCLHAHYAYHLAGGADPVGAWVARRVEPVHDAAARPRGRGRPGHELDPAAGGRARGGRWRARLRRDRARSRDHAARSGRRRDRPARSGARWSGPSTCWPGTAAELEPWGPSGSTSRRRAPSATRRVPRRRTPSAVREHAGSDLEVLTGEEEAALSFLGATAGLDPGRRAVPGARHRRRLDRARDRCPAGPCRAGREHADGERPAHRAPRAARPAHARGARGDGGRGPVGPGARRRRCRPAGARTLVACAGTPTTLQAMSLGLERYDPDRIHRTWLARDGGRADPPGGRATPHGRAARRCR